MEISGMPGLDALRRLLATSDTDAPILRPVFSVSQDVEQAVVSECRMLLIDELQQEYGIQCETVYSLPGVVAFSVGSIRIHLAHDINASTEGFVLAFRLRAWPYSLSEGSEEVLAIPVEGIGRIAKITIGKELSIPCSVCSSEHIRSKLKHVSETWYYSLNTYVDRLFAQLTTRAVEDIWGEVRRAVPQYYSGAIWLYAIINKYGVSLTDIMARQHVIGSVRKQRGQFEASPLEAAISLITVEMRRELSFSNDVLEGQRTEIDLPTISYARLIRDTESKLFGTETLTAMTLAVTPNKDIGVVAAFPKGEAAAVISQCLQERRDRFQGILDRHASQFPFLLGSVERLTKGVTLVSRAPRILTNGPRTPKPKVVAHRVKW